MMRPALAAVLLCAALPAWAAGAYSSAELLSDCELVARDKAPEDNEIAHAMTCMAYLDGIMSMHTWMESRGAIVALSVAYPCKSRRQNR